MDLDASLCRRLLIEVLPALSLLDPACGSGAFLVAAMKTLINIYSAIVGRDQVRRRPGPQPLAGRYRAGTSQRRLFHQEADHHGQPLRRGHHGRGDGNRQAAALSRLGRLGATVDDLEPLPNIDFNILPGNSLVGLLRVRDEDFDARKTQGNLFRKSYKQVLEEKNLLIDGFRHATEYAEDLSSTRDLIDEKKREAYETLDDILLDEFKELGIKYEQATWDLKKKAEGKPVKRPLKPTDIEGLHPFHWGYEFDEILNERGGFDAIITNPPWEVLKPNAKEFFEEFSDLISKKNMTIHEFEKEQAKLLKDEDTRAAWLEYLNAFPHQSAYFRNSAQYRNQISVVDGKKTGRTPIYINCSLSSVFRCSIPAGNAGWSPPAASTRTSALREFAKCSFPSARSDRFSVCPTRNSCLKGCITAFVSVS